MIPARTRPASVSLSPTRLGSRRHGAPGGPIGPRSGMRRASARVMVLALLALVLGACAGDIRSEPFRAFSDALAALHQGTDRALATIDQMSEDRFLRQAVEETGAGDPTKVEELRIKMDPDSPLAWRTEPFFLRIEQFRDGARLTTGALVAYADLLVTLAGPDLLPTEAFDKLSADLNANANDAIARITGGAPDADRLALFSTLAAESARLFLEQRRRSQLRAAVTANQTTVEAFARHMQEGVKIAATIAAHEYDERFQQIALSMIGATGPAPEAVRTRALQDLIALDRKHIAELGTFTALHQSYGRIPGAHLELARALSDHGLELTSIIALLEAGRRLERNFDQAVAVNKSKEAQAVADQALAVARVLEAEADAAQLRATAAEVEAVEARARAELDPGDARKRAIADDRQRSARELRDLARTRKASAEDARAAALTSQQVANEIKTKLLKGRN